MKINKLTGRWIENEVAMKSVSKKVRSRKARARKRKGPLPKTYVVMIMDRSSSMNGVREEARGHFNEQVTAIRNNAEGQDIRVSLVMFNGNVNYHYFNASLDSLQELSFDQYQPNGCTALNDAVGCTIDKMKSEIDDINEDHVSILFVIVTDGVDNVSRIYRRELRHLLADRMKSLQDSGRWTFTYMGTDHDVEKAASSYSIPKGNTMTFKKKNYRAAGAASNMATNAYLQSRKLGVKSADQIFDKKI